MTTKIDSTINVLMAEDESLFGELLQYKLATVPGIEVSGIATNGDAIVGMAREMKPDAMIVDSKIAGNMSGVEAAIEIKEMMPEIGMVLLTSYQDRRKFDRFPLDDTGGWSYLVRQSVPDVASIVRAIQGSVMGMVTLAPEIMDSLRPRSGSSMSNLTPRQLEVLDLLARGFNNGVIAERLTLNIKSVETYVHDIYGALGLHGDPQLHSRVKAALLYLEESQARDSMHRYVSMN